jgi:DNA-binding XRE family transcriptional regulator
MRSPAGAVTRPPAAGPICCATPVGINYEIVGIRKLGKSMMVGDRIRQLRRSKGLSQGDIGRRTGLLRIYVSRVEKGRTVPSVDTLERFAAALETPLYELLNEGNDVLEVAPKSR